MEERREQEIAQTAADRDRGGPPDPESAEAVRRPAGASEVYGGPGGPDHSMGGDQGPASLTDGGIETQSAPVNPRMEPSDAGPLPGDASGDAGAD